MRRCQVRNNPQSFTIQDVKVDIKRRELWVSKHSHDEAELDEQAAPPVVIHAVQRDVEPERADAHRIKQIAAVKVAGP